MHRLLAILLAILAGTSASALSGERLLLLGYGAPGWVLNGAAVDINFTTGQIYGCAALSSCLSISRASSKTDLLPSSASGASYNTFGNNVLAITPGNGLLIEEARANFLVNSTAPTTQTTGSLATGTYTLWVNGSGSAAMSLGTGVGCGVASASQGAPISFTITVAGTCIVTVTGSLNEEQLENGAFGTSFIVTAGTTVTRAADKVTATGNLLALIQRSSRSLVLSVDRFPGSAATQPTVLNQAGVTQALCYVTTSTSAATYQSGNVVVATLGNSTTVASNWKYAIGMDVTGTASAANGGSIATSATAINTNVPDPNLMSTQGNGSFYNGYFRRFTGFNSKLSNSNLIEFSQ